MLTLGVTACGTSSPAAIEDGSYVAYGSSDDAVPEASMEIAGDSVTITEAGMQQSLTKTKGIVEYTVCGTDGVGAPSPLEPGFTVGLLAFTNPAIYGDCGVTAPKRVTIIDLDSVEPDGSTFSRWLEFCDISDADCQGTALGER